MSKLRQKMEALADSLEKTSNREPNERLFKTAQRDVRVAMSAYKKCVKEIRKVLTETESP